LRRPGIAVSADICLDGVLNPGRRSSLLRTHQPIPSMSTPEKPQFLLLFRNRDDSPDPTPDEMQKIFGQWMEWMKGMKSKGQFVGADRLQDGGKVLRGTGGATVTDGPFAETKEIVGGYVIISADNLAKAAEIAKGCPGFAFGTIVEVRPIEQLPAI